MLKSSKYLTILGVIVALICVPTGLLAADGAMYNEDNQIEAGSMAADVLLARPLGIVATVVGFGLFVVSSPFSLAGRNAGEAWTALVTYPAKFTFARPLGEFD
ncbi:MAG: hypothetical protein VR64_06725 [Desulfatitalea sp. BRH_c12]|nr:MAG: hypothetical protein VR64_06725 [Desulfatitalea sp. BRH_c12]